MSSIFTPLRLEDLGDRTFRVLEPFTYLTAGVTVPAGFVTDYASVPRVFWNIVPPFGKYGKAAVLHDYLYAVQGRRPLLDTLTRAECDFIFLQAMRDLGVRATRRLVMYRAVRMFGWAAWRAHAPKDPPAGPPGGGLMMFGLVTGFDGGRVACAALAGIACLALQGCGVMQVEACRDVGRQGQVCAVTDFRTVKVRGNWGDR